MSKKPPSRPSPATPPMPPGDPGVVSGPQQDPGEAVVTHQAAMRLIAGVLVAGALSLLATILVPFFLAIVVAITLTPLAGRFERLGLRRTGSSLACMLLVASALFGVSGLITYQVGSIIGDSEGYAKRFGKLLSQTSHRVGGDRLLRSFGLIADDATEAKPDGGGARSGRLKTPGAGRLVPGAPSEGDTAASPPGRDPDPAGEAKAEDRPPADAPADSADEAGPASDAKPEAGGGENLAATSYWVEAIRRNAEAIGRWIFTGLGGLMGFLGGVVLFLAFLFYMLVTRTDWVDRIRLSAYNLGLRPRPEALERVAHQIRTYVVYLSMVSVVYSIVIGLALWALGVPNPLLWGALTAVLELIPFFGPIVAGALPTFMALGSGQGLWQPLAVVGVFATLQTIEGYVVQPMVYGHAVDIDPVTILLGVLFFGFLWGPLGLAAAMPMMILIRGLLSISPDTPALDALADVDQPATA